MSPQGLVLGISGHMTWNCKGVLTIVFAAVEGSGIVVGAQAVALAKLGEGHLGLGQQALYLHVHDLH